MTQLTGRPILEAPGELGARPVLSALLTGIRTALLGLSVVTVPVLGLWVVTPFADDGAAGALRLASALWLLGHGAPVLRGPVGVPLSVAPLGLGLLAVGQLYRAGGRVAARSAGRPGGRGGVRAVWAGYVAVACAVVAQCAGAGEFRARVVADLAVVALVAGAAVAAGARRPGAAPAGVEALARALAGLPERVRPTGGAPVVRVAALAAGAGLLAVGGLVVAVAAVLAAVGGGAGSAVFAGGPAAVAGVLLLTLVLLPNTVLWGAAYALGPGFAVGAGTVVSPVRTTLGPVPEFPLFALLPEPGAGGWRLAVCVLPALAGVVPGLLLGRAAAADGGLPDGGPAAGPVRAGVPWPVAATVVAALASGLLVGGAAAGLGWLAGGALGAGRMAWLGPVPWWTALAAAGWVALVSAPVAVLARSRALRTAAGGPGRSWRSGVPLVPGALAVTARRGALLLRARAYGAVTRLAGAPGVPTAPGAPAVTAPGAPGGPAR
ncbi:cell division protein PerM [Kitasatospora purpeofusca]|uniref:cell division protein PerM n=1 Tax=Kitasatospora purpeofusca TaxID=67352 RepID=UPI0038251CBC